MPRTGAGQKRKRSEVVDLTGDSDHQASRDFQSSHSGPSSSSQAGQRSSLSSQTSFDEEDTSNGDELIQSTQPQHADAESFIPYGIQHCKVVGIRYYNGYAANKERVLLRREPGNAYDRNAIQVLNVRGAQIGHCPRQIAAKLAKYMDSHELIVEGTLAGNRGEFDIPLNIAFFGPSEPEAKDRLTSNMSKDRLDLSILKKMDAEEKRRRTAELKKVTKGKRKQADSTADFTNAGITIGNPENAPEVDDFIEGAQVYNPREWTDVTEQNSAQEDQLKGMPKAPQPDLVSTKLLPFQLQGLAWLLQKENPILPKAGTDEIVQLWKKTSNGLYTNIATNFSLKNEEPKLARGGILADDMGLGKTMQVISLIAADRAKHGDQGPTLIVAPVSVMSNWSTQIERHIDPNNPLRVHTFHGSGRNLMKNADFQNYDVVITSYGTLSSEYLPKGSKQPPKMPTQNGFYSLHWRRIVLDEGHTIRNPQTKNALACCGIDAYAKWALTGTPVINSFKDLYSLTKFIGLSGGLDKAEIFNSVLTRPMKDGQQDARLLLQALMATICLRRRKDMAFVDLRLPALTEYLHSVELSKSEQKKYDALEKEAKGALETYGSATGANDGQKRIQTYRHLLEVLLRLRQVCNHWKLCENRVLDLMSLLDKKGSVDLTPDNIKSLQDLLQLSIESREECPVCIDDLHEPVITPCGHSFGRTCISRVIETQHKCPMCRATLKDDSCLVNPAVDCGDDASQNLGDDDDSTSAKTTALLELIAATLKRPGSKMVIFSQWRSYLDVISPHIANAGQTTVRIDGTMAARARDESLRRFAKDDKTRVMLASLGVCAVGLDLTAADTVVLCDSWWAPAIEDQAVDRVHRLGQTKECTVWRLVVKGSVEERTLDIQKRKRGMMAEALREGGRKERERKRGQIGDIQQLLS
ncbi:DNA repair and recombination protein RAD5B [Myriangium duriaei CBS 260.36]|uniref:DNA repair and recombination protein RAD5B n=1 Tax=Myriangium duriaei CBS 260.36 TaxID=1168546 RepID=A0A9P4JBW0_9PEZI|nr:DNA repair and recombination protein RAD5B [Myriangium duriaei CBS 260.36]